MTLPLFEKLLSLRSMPGPNIRALVPISVAGTMKVAVATVD